MGEDGPAEGRKGVAERPGRNAGGYLVGPSGKLRRERFGGRRDWPGRHVLDEAEARHSRGADMAVDPAREFTREVL